MPRVLLFLGILAVTASCTLLIDTDGFRDETANANEGGTDVSVESATIPQEAGSDVGPASPCMGTFLLCETFDTAQSLTKHQKVVDPTTSVEFDGVSFFSPPGAAVFDIKPSTNTSADATLRLESPEAVADFSLDAKVFIEYGEPGDEARLFQVANTVGRALLVNQAGEVRESNTIRAQLGPVPMGRWLAVHAEIRAAANPATAIITIEGATTGSLSLPDAWRSFEKPAVRLGVSESNSPTKGWRVRWDDVVFRKL